MDLETNIQQTNQIQQQQPSPTIFQKPIQNTPREKILSIVFSVGPIIMMIVVMVLFQTDSSLKLAVVQFFHQLASVNGYTILVILGIGAALVIISAPYLLFELCLGYTFNYFLAISFSVLAKFIGESVCYMITKYALKDYFLQIFSQNEYFQILSKAAKDHPWKISHIMRSNALMPLFIINFGSGLLEINFIQFIFPAVLWGAVYSSVSVYAGSQFHNIEQIINNSSVKGKSNGILMYFELGVVVLSIILIVVIILFSKMYFQEIRQEIRKQREIELQQSQYSESTNNNIELQGQSQVQEGQKSCVIIVQDQKQTN